MLSLLRRHSLSRLQYGITNPHIYHGKTQLKHDLCLNSYPLYGIRNHRSGVVILNRPNYENKLSLQSMEEMYRFLRSFEVDENAQHIWIENRGYNCFSNGIDYQQLIKSPKYLHRVFQLGIMMSKINKPVLGYVKGLVGGTSAYLLKYLSSPFGDNNTHLKLHDVDNHFVPICGGSYLLSRLKGQLGAYLALTGDEVKAHDMVGSGFIYGLLRRDFSEAELRRIAGQITKVGKRYFDHDAFDVYEKPNLEHEFYEDNQDTYLTNLQIERKLIMADPRKELRVARLAEVEHKNLQVMMENLKKPYVQKSDEYIINHFNLKEDAVLPTFEKDFLQPNKGEVVRGFPLLAINRTFKFDTVEQIVTALKKEGTQWANNTIKKLESKDPLALKLTLKLIREAQKSTFPECLEREHRVASKLRLHEPFRKFHAGQELPRSQISEISSATVNRFFERGDDKHELTHDIVPNPLLPVKEYRRSLPDAVRYFLNKDYWNDPNNTDQMHIVHRWLRRQNIALKNDSWDLGELRRRIYIHHYAALKMQEHWGRIDRLYYNYTAEKAFKDVRARYVEKLFSEKQKISKRIDEAIVQNFNKRFNSRMDDLKPTAEIFAKEQKGKLYSAIRNILVKKRLTETLEMTEKDKAYHVGLVMFDPEGKGVFQNPTHIFKGTPFEHIINCTNEQGEQTKPFPPEYYALLDTELDPRKVNPLITAQNPQLIQVLRRYEDGLYFYKDTREDVAFLEQASLYCSKVKKLLEQYSPEELKDILHREERFSWKHMLRQVEKHNLEDYFKITKFKLDPDTKAPGFQQLYDLSSQDETILGSISVSLPPEFKIPKELQERSNKLLKLISSKILSNFGDWHGAGLDNAIPVLDNWIKKSVAQDVNEFIKNDCHFIFSYFMIKDIEGIVTRLGSDVNSEQLLQKLEMEGITFSNWEDVQPTFHKFVSDLVELYNTSVKNIVLKNTKLLQMHNRIKINQEITQSMPSVDSFLIELGKLRLKIKNRANPQPTIFDYDTQFNLQALGQNNIDPENPQFRKKMNQLSITVKHYDFKYKRLIKGFESYIERIDQMFKDINSSTDFLPESLLVVDNLDGFEKLTQDIDQNEPLDVWFDRKLAEAIEVVFNHRLEAEKNLNDNELKLLDQEISKFLEPASLKSLILQILDNDITSLLSIKEQKLKSEDNGTQNQPFSTRRLILNQEAFRRLNNLVHCIDIVESRQDTNRVRQNYVITLMRLAEQVTSEPQPKQLNQQALQKMAFTRSRLWERPDLSEINYVKDELKVLASIYSDDEDMAELAKVLG